MSTESAGRRRMADAAARTIAEIVRDLDEQTGCRVEVDVRAVETTTFGEHVRGEASHEYTVEVTVNERYTGRA